MRKTLKKAFDVFIYYQFNQVITLFSVHSLLYND